MKYSLSNIIKDLLAKIPVLENRINTLSTKITNINKNADTLDGYHASDLLSKMQGNEFVKSKDAANNIAFKYEQKDGEDKKTLHAYVDGVEVPLASQSANTNQNDGTLKHDRKYKLEFHPVIATSYYFNGGRPRLTGEIDVRYYYADIYSNDTTVKTTTLSDGLVYDDPDSSDPANEALRKANDYIREHANHFLEEAYEKIPEARNADEIIY